MEKSNFIFDLYKDNRTVFTINEIALLIKESDYSRLKQKVYYYAKKGVIQKVRNGIYVKQGYNPEELASKLYTPSYISLEYVLSKAGWIFQYSKNITLISYLSRTLEVDNNTLCYRKAKADILINSEGVIQKDNGVSIASPERAFLDMLYLDKNFYFDNLSGMNESVVLKLLNVYKSASLNKRVKEKLNNIKDV